MGYILHYFNAAVPYQFAERAGVYRNDRRETKKDRWKKVNMEPHTEQMHNALVQDSCTFLCGNQK